MKKRLFICLGTSHLMQILGPLSFNKAAPRFVTQIDVPGFRVCLVGRAPHARR